MKLTFHVMSSPVGLLFLARTERGLRYLEFMDRKSLKRMIASHAKALPDATWEPSLLGLKAYVDQLDQYFCGERMEFTLPLDPVGSEFQIQVWRGLQLIPYGETRSYGELARAIGQPRASRAVGLANHENSIAIVIPCHRVIGAGGALVGYGGGVARKKWLLDHETRFAHPVGRTGDLFPSMSDAGSPYRTSVAAAPPGGMTPRTPNATGSAKSGARGANPKTTHATLAARSPARGTALKTAHMAAAARSPARGAVTRKTPRATAAPKSGARAARAAPRAPVRRRRG